MPRLTSRQKQSSPPVVLVAGGAGFLGSHLCESLLNSGATVLAVDDLVTGSLANLEQIQRHPHFEFFECNINQGLLQSLVEKPITHVVQTIGAETHGNDTELTLAGLLAGSFGTKNLLDLAVATGARFLLASSLYIYEGLASSASLVDYFGSKESEETQFSGNEAKRYSEALCELYAKEYNLDVRVARLSQMYGPRMDLSGNSVVTTLIREAVTGQDLQVAGESSREIMLTYVVDAVYGLSRLLFAEGEQYRKAIYPLANPEKVSIISIAYTLRGYLDPGKEVNFSDAIAAVSPALPKLSLERSQRDLDWEPAIGLTEGLKQTIAYFKQNRNVSLSHKPKAEQMVTKQRADADSPTVSSPAQPPAEPVIPAQGWQNGLKFRGSVGAAVEAAPDTTTAPAPKPATTLPAQDTTRRPEAGKTTTTTTPRVQVKPKSWWRRLLFGLVMLTLYFSFARPVIQTTVLAASGAIELRQGLGQAKTMNMAQATQSFGRAKELLASAQISIKPLAGVTGMMGQSGTFEQINQGFEAAVNASAGLSTLCQTAQPMVAEMTTLAHFRHPSKASVDLNSLSEQALLGLHQAQSQFGQAIVALSGPGETQVAGARSGGGTEQLGEAGLLTGDIAHTRDLLIQAQAALSQAEPIIKALPDLLGENGRKTYLVMLQNSNELRPTGGFMGSYAKIQISHGKVVNFVVDDIHNPDGQLHSQMPAPAAFATAFGVKQQYLRDANWSPDAAVSAQEIESLFQQATGQKVDGVAFVTTAAIRNMLTQTGPLYLSSFHEQVTAQNFDTLAQIHSDVGFTPGSTAKKDFLGQLAEQMINRLEQGGFAEWSPLGKGIAQSLTTRDVQLYTDLSEVQAVLDSQGWSGRTKAFAGDYLSVIDANLGSNKANYYVTRSTSYSVDVDRQSQLHGVLKISWNHKGTSGTWPGGDYVDYVRIYVPKGTHLTAANNFSSPTLDVYDEQGKTVFGGFVRVPYHSQKTVEIRYDLPETLGLTVQNGTYELLWQKQAGVSGEPLSVSFNAPIFLKATAISGNGQVSNNTVNWQTTITQDSEFKLQTVKAL